MECSGAELCVAALDVLHCTTNTHLFVTILEGKFLSLNCLVQLL